MSRHSEFQGRETLIRKRAVSTIVWRLFVGTVAIFMIGGMGILVANAIASFDSRDILLDCNRPTGACYLDKVGKAENREEETRRITKMVVIAAVACSKEKDTAAEVTKCVNELTKDK